MAHETKELYHLVIGLIGGGPWNGRYYFTSVERKGGLTFKEREFLTCFSEGNKDVLLWNVGQICQLSAEGVQRFSGELELKIQPEVGSSVGEEGMGVLRTMVTSRNRYYRLFTDQP